MRRTFWVVINLLSMASFLGLAFLLTFWPQRVAMLHLTLLDAQVLLMELISLLLLLAFLGRNVSKGWRWFTLTASFVVLSESILMSGVFFQ